MEEQAPKVLFADAVIGSRSSCLIGELAKIISQNGFHVGQNRLFEWLRNNHYLGSVGERRNIPNQQYVERGLFSPPEYLHRLLKSLMKCLIWTNLYHSIK